MIFLGFVKILSFKWYLFSFCCLSTCFVLHFWYLSHTIAIFYFRMCFYI